jgi:hypothetical protein
MDQAGERWQRGPAEQKVLLIASEEGFVCELLDEGRMLTERGWGVDPPALTESTARAAVAALIAEGLVGTHRLERPNVWLVGEDALRSVTDPSAWVRPVSNGLCLYLTDLGMHEMGMV